MAGKVGGHAHPHIAIDYGFLGDDSGRSGTSPVLFGIEVTSSLALSMVVPAKRNSTPWIAKGLAQWIDQLGSMKVMLKADGEPAMVALFREIRGNRQEGAATLHEAPE